MDEEVRAYLSAVCAALETALGDDLVGVYLHGSVALGDYDPRRSDIDLLAVCRRPLTAAARSEAARRLARRALPCPARGLELSLVTRAAAADPEPAPAYELHGWDDHGELHGDNARGDPDLPLHFAVTRASGTALAGPPPNAVFRDVPRDELLVALAAELAWAERNASPSYRVLGACRAWRYLDEGTICSKRAAAEWALAHGGPAPLLTRVLAHHLDAAVPELDPDQVQAFAAGVQDRLRGAGADTRAG